jgi:hypothetical protein
MYCPDFAIYGTKVAVGKNIVEEKEVKSAGGEK